MSKNDWTGKLVQIGGVAFQRSGHPLKRTPFSVAFEGFLLPNCVAALFGIEVETPKPTEAEVAFA
ncbi:hypothetical protein [Azospirillum canadense]|uniref:hypothetical protein n=1 Tax=Azospirillum canadense TaxID=403962 RepID=UPI0022273C74|nr:hypothetical protein [Azospirillum canadense]MCW2240396.1 hypothetical protein [Azospirillum canadense]